MRKKAFLIQVSIVGAVIFIILSYFPQFFVGSVDKLYGFPFEYLIVTHDKFEVIGFNFINLFLEIVISLFISLILVFFVSLILMPFKKTAEED